MVKFRSCSCGAVAQLGARLDGIEEVVGSNPIGSTNKLPYSPDTSFTERSGDMAYMPELFPSNSYFIVSFKSILLGYLPATLFV